MSHHLLAFGIVAGLFVSGCGGGGIVAHSPVEPDEPRSVDGPRHEGDVTYAMLAEVVTRSAEIVARLDREAVRPDGLKLTVDFSFVRTLKDEEWPEDFAPRAEYDKLMDRALAELREARLFEHLATIGRRPSIRFPEAELNRPRSLSLLQLGVLLEAARLELARAATDGCQKRSAEIAATHIGVARLLSQGDARVLLASVTQMRRAVVAVMPLIVHGAVNAEGRRLILASLEMPRLTAPEYSERTRREWREEATSIWGGLPPEVFRSGAEAEAAWAKLDPRVRRGVAGLAGRMDQAFAEDPELELPVPALGDVMQLQERIWSQVAEWQPLAPVRARAAANEHERKARGGKDGFGAMMASALIRAEHGHLEMWMLIDAVRVAIALEDYREATGGYPESLDALCPAYLTTVPVDPATPGEKLKYARSAREIWGREYPYVLYSDGPDGVDDGGAPMAWADVDIASGRRGEDVILNALH